MAGEAPGGGVWTFLYLPAEGPPGAWSEDGFRLRDLNTVTIGDLPARFDWSIMGWTILLLALMNLQEREREERMDGKEEADRNKCQCIPQNKIRQKLLTKTMKILARSTKTNAVPNPLFFFLFL